MPYFILSIWFEIEVHNWRNQKFMSLMARSALNLYECAVSISDANSTLWIFKEQPIDREISINNKDAFCKAALVLTISIVLQPRRTKRLVEDDGIEPTTPCLQSRCSPSWANPPSLAISLAIVKMVGLVGLEPTTPALSRRCSNQLSYRPIRIFSNIREMTKIRPSSNNR